MSRLASALARLFRQRKGSATIEFGLVAPAIIVMIMGVLQVGIAVQNYNALRGVSSEVSRYAMI